MQRGHARLAFTFVEILLAITLLGVITTGAVAPLIMLVNSLQDVEKDYVGEMAIHKSLSLIFRDLRSVNTCPSGNSFFSRRRELQGDLRRDILVFWTVSPSGYPRGAGSLVYMIPEQRWGRDSSPSLYRWFLPSVLPEKVQHQDLVTDSPNAQLVLPDVQSLSVEVWNGTEWAETYQGPVPAAVKVGIERKEDALEAVEWIPR